MKSKLFTVYYFQFLVFSFLVFSSFAFAAYNDDVDSSVVKTSVESISPYPVEPGTDFTMQLRIYNDGSVSSDGTMIEYEASEFFHLTGVDDNFNGEFSICSGCSVNGVYNFVALPGTPAGEYPIKFKITDNGNEYEEKVLVRVVGKPDVVFSGDILGEDITPGGDVVVNLDIKNVGTGVARNVKFLPKTDGVVMNGENIIFIDEIAPGKIESREIVLMFEDDMAPGPKRIEFDILYKDEKAEEYEFSQSLGLMVKNIVEMDFSSLKVEPVRFTQGKEGMFTVRIENMGEGTAKEVEVNLNAADFLGQKKAYIGMLEEDEDAPAIYRLTPLDSGDKTIEVVVTYNDDEGEKELRDTIVIGVDQNNRLNIITASIGVLFVILIVGYFFIHRK